MSEQEDLIVRRLLSWYDQRQRDLPWRGTSDPYAVWVAEVMLQQTRVSTVRPHYRRWMASFPTVADLAEASLDAVLKAWEGLGYYARARNLHRAAQEVATRHGGRVPDSWDAFRALPGVGGYTAGAVLSIAFGQRVPAVDGNARRVLARHFAVDVPVTRASTQRQVRELADSLVPPNRPGDFNQALMDLGAEICRPRRPRCRDCPLRESCVAREQGRQAELPHRDPPRRIPHHPLTAAVIWGPEGKLLLARRPWQGFLGGLWMFPGGRQRADLSLEASLRAEVRAMLGIGVRVDKRLVVLEHAYSHFRSTLHAFEACHLSGQPQALGCAEWQWRRPSSVADLALSRADQKVLEAVFAELAQRGS